MARSVVSAEQLNRATLDRQLLLRRSTLGVTDALRRVVALQAQEAASPYIALWSRVAGFDPVELDTALIRHDLVKATLMRVTLHVVHADDYPGFHEAMQRTLRAARFHDDRFKAAGLTSDEVEALVPELLSFAAQQRSNAEMEAWLDERAGRTLERPGVWWALRHVGPFVHAPGGSAAWSFGPRPSYLAAPRQERAGDWEQALRGLVRRYLAGFGPASVADLAQFTMLYKGWIRPVVEAMRDELVALEGPTGIELFDIPEGVLPAEEVPAPPRLLPMWDSILLAYADRSRVIPEQHRRVIIRSNGDVLPTLLVDGYVAGVWRPLDGRIQASSFDRLADDTWAGLEAEATSLLEVIGARDPRLYSRYTRWWDKLPRPAEVRLLG